MESEWLTRKKRIDPRLEAAGWSLRGSAGGDSGAWRIEELPTATGPADYALVVDGQVLDSWLGSILGKITNTRKVSRLRSP